MVLSDRQMLKLIVRETEECQEAKGWWERGEWDRIGERIIIEPFDTSNVSAISYELSVGPEWLSLRDPYTVRQLNHGQVITLAPHESIILLSEQYVALPRTIGGLVVPRARKLFEGSTIAATRVDPTWYGRLRIGFTNASQYPTSLGRGERFCNLILFKADEVERALSRSDTPHLGQAAMGKPEYPGLRLHKLKAPDEVVAADLAAMVDSFGSPFDIVRGALGQTKDEVIRAVEKDFGPRMVDTAVTQATQRAFKHLQWMFGVLLGLFGILVAGLLTFLFRGK